jgi:hypothetical protein
MPSLPNFDTCHMHFCKVLERWKEPLGVLGLGHRCLGRRQWLQASRTTRLELSGRGVASGTGTKRLS